MKERMKKLYEEQKRGRMKAVIISLSACFLMTGIVSIFLGNPFPYKEKVLFLEMTGSGWIQTHGYAVYGKKLDFKGYKRAVFLLAQQK